MILHCTWTMFCFFCSGLYDMCAAAGRSTSCHDCHWWVCVHACVRSYLICKNKIMSLYILCALIKLKLKVKNNSACLYNNVYCNYNYTYCIIYWHIGSIYIDDCVGNNRIPIWLVVFGCVSLVQTFINVCKRCAQQVAKKSRDSDDDSSGSNAVSRSGGCIESLLSGFLFVWIIVGSVWVFSIYSDYQNGFSNNPNACRACCHQVPYLFSFIVLLVIYSISALFCCCICCCFCGLVFVGAASDDWRRFIYWTFTVVIF